MHIYYVNIQCETAVKDSQLESYSYLFKLCAAANLLWDFDVFSQDTCDSLLVVIRSVPLGTFFISPVLDLG